MGERVAGQLEKYIVLPDKETNYQVTDDDMEFWGQQLPEQVILATGSIRKILMLIAQIDDFSFKFIENGIPIEISEPMELRRYFHDNIYNGNGSLKEKTFLGYLHGVKLYAEPSDGETDSNDNPYQEAVNKAMGLLPKYHAQNILIVSTDTVDQPDAAKNPLGKPENETDFPNPQDQVYNLEAFFDEKAYKEAVDKWLEEYKQRFYVVSEAIIHTNAVAILNALTGDLIDTGNNIIELNIKIDHEKLKMFQAKIDEAGGGMTQMLIDWENIEEVMSYFGELTKNLLPKEVEKIKMALICQITGSPYAIIELIRLAQQRIINDNLEE